MSLLIRSRVNFPRLGTVIYRTLGGLFFPEVDHFVGRGNNCLAFLSRPDGTILVTPGANIVTDAGDIFCAQLFGTDSPTDTFTLWSMASAGTPAKGATDDSFTLIASSDQTEDATYPTTNDGDGDNTGAATDTRTTRVSYTAASFNHAAITHAFITNPTPGATEPILAGWAWSSSINKTSADTLKCFHNATASGV